MSSCSRAPSRRGDRVLFASSLGALEVVSWGGRLLLLGRRGGLGRRPVLGARLLAVGDPQAVEDASDDVVADPRQVADPAAADQDDRVLLEVVALAGDVRGDFLAVGEPN